MQEPMTPLTLPVPIIFTVAMGFQQLANGAINVLGIYDRLTVGRLPTGETPEAVSINVYTQWTGGVGEFEQKLEVLDEDGARILEARAPFALPITSARAAIVAVLVVPARAGIYSMILSRGDDELLRQDFTLAVADSPLSPA